VLTAFVRDDKHDAKTDFVKRGYDKLLAFQVDDGGIYKNTLANYNTASPLAPSPPPTTPAYRDQIDKAVAYLKGLQWSENTRPEHPDEAKRPPLVAGEADPFYGGWGYGGLSRAAPGRPDLSNVQMTSKALKDAGLKEDPTRLSERPEVRHPPPEQFRDERPPSGPATTAASSTAPPATARARASPASTPPPTAAACSAATAP
jgi:hypothetical protein